MSMSWTYRRCLVSRVTCHLHTLCSSSCTSRNHAKVPALYTGSEQAAASLRCPSADPAQLLQERCG